MARFEENRRVNKFYKVLGTVMLGAAFPKPNLVLRSSSTSDVFVDSEVPSLKPRLPSRLNSQPQDFVITNGSAYRVARSPRGFGSGDVGRQSPVNVTANSGDNSYEQSKVRMLLKALDEANRKIMEQNEEILRHRKQIIDLERELGREPSFVIAEEMYHITSATYSAPAAISSNNLRDPGSISAPPLLTPRSKSKIHNAINTEKRLASRGSSITSTPASTSGTPGWPASRQISTSSDTGQDEQMCNSIPLLVPATNDPSVDILSAIPTSPLDVDASCDFCAKERVGAAGDEEPSKPSGDHKRKALAARLSLSTKARRKQQEAEGNARATGNTRKRCGIDKRRTGLEQGSDSSSGSSTFDAVYVFKVDPEESLRPQLFIAHDNPQLGKNIAAMMASGGGAGRGLQEVKVQAMVESKDTAGLTCFLLGEVAYSGRTEGVVRDEDGGDSGGESRLDAAPSRGSQCLVCSNLRAFRLKLESAPTRLRSGITEISLRGGLEAVQSSADKTIQTPVAAPECAEVDIGTDQQLATFLEQCTCRVDVILAPHNVDSWYPYWEGEAPPGNTVLPPPGSRKLAPQFRSNGVGYLRLGDDMSRFGTSFLSIDGLRSFLDNSQSTNIIEAKKATSVVFGAGKVPLRTYMDSAEGNVDTSRLKIEAGFAALGVSSPKGALSRRMLSSGSADLSIGSSCPCSGERSRADSGDTNGCVTDNIHNDSSCGGTGADDNAMAGVASMHVILDELSAPAPAPLLVGVEVSVEMAEQGLKWSDRVARLHRVYEYLAKSPSASPPTDLFCNIATVLQSHMLRQKNPLVLKESVGCAGRLAKHWREYSVVDREGKLLAPWAEVLVCTVHLLRHANRGVADAAKATLPCLAPVTPADVPLCLTVFLTLAENMEVILSGAVKSGVGGGTSKVVRWLSSFICEYTMVRRKSDCAVTSGSCTSELHEVASVVRRVFVLLGHREESVREYSVELLARLFALDVCISEAWRPQLTASTSSQPSPRQHDDQVELRRRSQSEQAVSTAEMLAGPSFVFPEEREDCDPLVLEAEALAGALSPLMWRCLVDHLTGEAAISASPHTKSRLLNLSREYISQLSTARAQKESLTIPVSDVSAADKVPNESALSSLTEKRRTGRLRPTRRRNDECENSPKNDPPVDTSRLSGMLFEAQLILRNPELSSRDAWDDFAQAIEKAPVFFDSLRSSALKLNMAPGLLLRRVLPFDEDTSSNDQSAVNSTLSALSADMRDNCRAAGINDEVIVALRSTAMEVRRTIRVKMADEADLKQAETAIIQLNTFRSAVLAQCDRGGDERKHTRMLPHHLISKLSQ